MQGVLQNAAYLEKTTAHVLQTEPPCFTSRPIQNGSPCKSVSSLSPDGWSLTDCHWIVAKRNLYGARQVDVNSLPLLIPITVYTIYFHPQHTVPTASEKDNMVISYLTLNIISIKTVSSIAVSLTSGDYCLLYTIYHIQAYIIPLPLNPIKIGIFVPIHHTVLC